MDEFGCSEVDLHSVINELIWLGLDDHKISLGARRIDSPSVAANRQKLMRHKLFRDVAAHEFGGVR